MSYDETNDRSTKSEPDDAEREVRDLLRSAGRRGELPREDLARIQQSARAAWRERYGSGPRRQGPAVTTWRLLAVAAAVLVALVAAWLWVGRAPIEPVQVATVERLSGVMLGVVDGRLEGRALAPGSLVLAPGELAVSEGVAALRMAGGESVRLAAPARLRTLSAERLELLEGRLYVDSDPARGASGLAIITRAGTVRELGTQYQVHLDGESGTLGVAVREGAVVVAEGRETHRAGRGEALILGSDGSVARRSIALFGPAWDWVTAAAPRIEIEGRSLAEFLAWVSRQSGWEVRFADAELESAAGEILLHGTIEGLALDDAVRVVVAGSGLEYGLEEGVLEIRRR